MPSRYRVAVLCMFLTYCLFVDFAVLAQLCDVGRKGVISSSATGTVRTLLQTLDTEGFETEVLLHVVTAQDLSFAIFVDWLVVVGLPTKRPVTALKSPPTL